LDYYTSVHQVDAARARLLLEASIQAYSAFDESKPEMCRRDKVTPPTGYTLVDSWTGVDAIFSEDRSTECYGLVFRSDATPSTYIFAFRGTDSPKELLEDLGLERKAFVPFESDVPVGDAEVESGFFDIYTETNRDPSMQSQLFALVDKYCKADEQMGDLLVTGHSLGAALSQLFTLDLALSRPQLTVASYNYACPRVGNSDFVALYEAQTPQRNPATRTLRVQNTYDVVPCNPVEAMGYLHTSPALLLAFYEDKLDVVGNHASAHYKAVLDCADGSPSGVCVESLHVDGITLTSIEPSTTDVCEPW